MSLKIVVCINQVVDPEIPKSSFLINQCINQAAPKTPDVLNGFDENAIEAALRIKDSVGAHITALSLGTRFAMDIFKKPLSMGADDLVLIEYPNISSLDSFNTASILSMAINKIGDVDLILCGRQASDWDNGQVPLGIAEIMRLPCITLAQKIDIQSGNVIVERVVEHGYEIVETELPALVTVSNELGEPRYATLRGIMAAGRKTPTIWSADALGKDISKLTPKTLISNLFIVPTETQCELIKGQDEVDSGRLLALKLREKGLI